VNASRELDSHVFKLPRRFVANSSAFHDQLRQLGNLITQFDQMPDGLQKAACKEMVQLLMDVYGVGLERMLEIVFESGSAASGIIDEIGRDSIAGSLLLLNSLHPCDVETRLRRAMERLAPRLRKLACTAELVSAAGGAVKVKVTNTRHSRRSSAKDLRAIVEEGVNEFAPDVTSLEVLGLEQVRRMRTRPGQRSWLRALEISFKGTTRSAWKWSGG